ncbi:hypothetical protein BHM03_00030797 [Ensete ventricosum]|nr:hypothetical protein BHM03_00030797 [Ensete ventricosum]
MMPPVPGGDGGSSFDGNRIYVLLIMGHPATAWDQNSVLEVVKDWNGIDQVVLRVPRGASARVRYYPIDSFFSVSVTIWPRFVPCSFSG